MEKKNKHPLIYKKTLMINALIGIIFFIAYFIVIFLQPRHNFYYVSLAGILIYVTFLSLAIFFYYKTGKEKLVRFFVSAFYFFQTAYLIALIASYAPAIGRLTFQFYLYCIHCLLSLALFICALLQHANYNLKTRKRIIIALSAILIMFLITTIIHVILIIIDFARYGFSIEYFLTLISYFVYIFGTNVAFLIEYYYYKIDEEAYYLSLVPVKKVRKRKKSTKHGK